MNAEILTIALKNYFLKHSIRFVGGNCLVFDGIAIRVRGSWAVINEKSYRFETPEEFLNILAKMHLIEEITEHVRFAFPNRVNKLLNI